MNATLNRGDLERIVVAALRDCERAHGSAIEGSWIGSATKRIVAGIINHETNRQNNAQTPTPSSEREATPQVDRGPDRREGVASVHELQARQGGEGSRQTAQRGGVPQGQSAGTVGNGIQGFVNTPDIDPVESLSQQMDVEAAFNMRGWVKNALEAKGATITGAGVGCGGSDLDFEVEGYKFNVFIKPR